MLRRKCASADALTGFQYCDPHPCIMKRARRPEPGRAGADHQNIEGIVRHCFDIGRAGGIVQPLPPPQG